MLTSRKLCHILALLVLMLLPATAQQAAAQVKGEYFWNEDPGVGKATRMGAAGSEDGYMTFDIAADKIPAGMNILGLRAFSGGRWTNTVTYFVMVPAQPAAADWRVEYFWDNDPGVGKATPLDATLGADGGLVIADVPADGLEPGEHLVGFRTCSGRAWSQTVTYTVMVPAKPGSADWRAEYFWDKDPGVGNGTPLTTSLGQNGGEIEADISTDGLEPGEHLLGFRTCSGHAWSQTVTSTMVVSDPRQYAIIGAEYFWGADPGFGNGTAIDVTPGEEVTIEDLEIEFPEEKADEYILSFRARSEKGWGITQTTVIPHLYVEALTLSAEKSWLEPGESLAVTAEVTPVDAFVTALEWTSTNPEVATVDANGIVTGVSKGTVGIIGTTTDGSEISDTLELTVVVPVKQIAVTPRELTLEMTREATLTAAVTPADASDTAVLWSVMDGEDIVTVSESGVVTGLQPGTARVVATAADGCGASDTCLVTVTWLRGDANGNGSLAVNDVVLTARGVVGDIDEALKIEAVDMNADNVLTVGDLTRVVDAVITYAAPEAAPGIYRAPAFDFMAAPLLLSQAGSDVTVALDDDIYTGVQFDVVSPDGLAVTSVTLDYTADGHSGANYRFDGGALRMLAYGTGQFPARETIATIHT
ncbi:MAG: Ig-like domain-containing protein, partial [Muribaculaceae bacterium]|nr:Ig-like domain-containing protein [Muribaculaceae bacterium]